MRGVARLRPECCEPSKETCRPLIISGKFVSSFNRFAHDTFSAKAKQQISGPRKQIVELKC